MSQMVIALVWFEGGEWEWTYFLLALFCYNGRWWEIVKPQDLQKQLLRNTVCGFFLYFLKSASSQINKPISNYFWKCNIISLVNAHFVTHHGIFIIQKSLTCISAIIHWLYPLLSYRLGYPSQATDLKSQFIKETNNTLHQMIYWERKREINDKKALFWMIFMANVHF